MGVQIMKKYRKYVTERLWEDYKCLQNNPHNFDSFVNYFNSLVLWIQRHRDEIHDDWLSRNQLNTLLNIKAEDYVSDNPYLDLTNEPKRIFKHKPKTMDGLLMGISDILWELVKLPSGKNCPNCKDGGLNYVIAEKLETKEKKIILQCDICIRQEYLDGSKCLEVDANIYPANKNDLKVLGVNI